MTPKRSKPDRIPTPRHLSPASKRWFRQVSDNYALEPHHVRLLTLAAESWDRAAMARESIAKNGLVYKDKFGNPRARPEVAVERDSRLAFARLLRELGLDAAPPPDAQRPPRVGGWKY